MVSMARPMLADGYFVKKAMEGKADEINICIGCNQACLDHVFERKTASCLVNPRACHETELNYLPATNNKKVAVVGAGPAGLAVSTIAAERGHRVDLFEAASEIGGQFNMAKKIPGKEEFYETLKYFNRQIELTGVNLSLNNKVTAEDLIAGNYDEVIIATGVSPRKINLPGIEHPKVLSYVDVLLHNRPVGERVALIGAGGIGFDVAEFLSHEGESTALNVSAFMQEWGVDQEYNDRGGMTQANVHPSPREIYLLQRSKGKLGAKLGKTTGWIHRSSLKKKKINMMGAVEYIGIDDSGLHIKRGGKPETLAVDNIVVCAGQESLKDLYGPLKAKGVSVHLVGGADVAAELDAKRAIDQGARLAAVL